MALTNIELYEALKKDLSEDAARMIAEVVPKAEDVASKSDIDRLELVTKTQLLEVEQRLDRRISALERRFFVIFAVPLLGLVATGIVKYLLG